MSIVTLEAYGSDFDVDAFLGRSPKVQVDTIWHRGDEGWRGEVIDSNGFRMTISDRDSSTETIEHLDRFLREAAGFINDLSANRASVQINVGLFVGSDEHYTSSVSFTPALLQAAAHLGVELCVVGYPVSDEESDDLAP
ncbi:MAG TPA: hypothetical protein VJY35_04475 [Candidatus Eisenbacteria bacterium]|nr:hypothetical protein [Candidatus Eisenbacteria bacterium]